jgi:hypothetical protein
MNQAMVKSKTNPEIIEKESNDGNILKYAAVIPSTIKKEKCITV